MTWSILIDFDGTIAKADTTDLLLSSYADPEWVSIEQDWVEGRIGSQECMDRQIALVRATPGQLREFAAQVEVDEGFVPLVTFCRQQGFSLAIVSDGLDLIIKAVMARLGLDMPVYANTLLAVGQDRWSLLHPFSDKGCRVQSGTCKCAIADSMKARTLLIGDGRSDQCLAGQADMVFAKAGLVDYCAQQGIAHQRFDTFADALPLLAQLSGTRETLGLPAHP